MSYKAGEAAVLSLIQALSDFDSTNSISLANDTTGRGHVLQNSGQSDHYIKLRPGEFERNYDTVGLGTITTNWVTIIEIAVFRGTNQAKSAEQLLADYREAVMNKLDAYYRLNATAAFGQVTYGDEIEEDTVDKLGAYIVQEIFLTWQERTTVTQND
jgi:hypothetical protein